MNDEPLELVRGSGNVFADFGYPNADAEQLKALLAAEIIGVSWDQCEVVFGNTSKNLPWTCASGGSQTTHAMTRANLAGANLTEASLRDADLRGASLDGAQLVHVDLSRARLDYLDLRTCRVVTNRLEGAYLAGTAFQVADLSGADLRAATFDITTRFEQA